MTEEIEKTEDGFNLIYKNKETGEVKNFSRDKYRNYIAQDGTEMSKSESWTKWTFMGKHGVHKSRERSASRNLFERARERLRSLHYASEIATSEKLDNYLEGYMDCLSVFESK